PLRAGGISRAAAVRERGVSAVRSTTESYLALGCQRPPAAAYSGTMDEVWKLRSRRFRGALVSWRSEGVGDPAGSSRRRAGRLRSSPRLSRGRSRSGTAACDPRSAAPGGDRLSALYDPGPSATDLGRAWGRSHFPA